MKFLPRNLLLVTLVGVLSGCGKNTGVGGSAGDATATTVAANATFAAKLNLKDQQEFEDAKRGLIARPTGQIKNAKGEVIRNFDAFRFLEGDAPPTVNPSLWRHAVLDEQIGLFKVTEHIYQLRGFDNANLTLIEGKTGWIVVDALGNRDSAAAAMDFAAQHLGKKPVSALVLTHSHIDHFGGVLGVVSPKDIADRKIPVVAPAGFMEEATSENILVGIAMGRRSSYQFGKDLEPSAKGLVDVGNGKTTVYGGAYGIVAPNWLIYKPTQQMTLDGVDFVFHNVPGAECPAELTFTIPAMKAYNGAENLAQTMHNLLPIRGAKVRDSFKWATYLDQALEQTEGMEVYFAQHNWPIWGNARIKEFITKQRDVYKYTHDQTVRLINAGYTPREIADMVKLPKSLDEYFGARGYYGDLRANVKAVYQMYIGAYDGNPANLNPLAPTDSAKRYMDAMGGVDKAVGLAQAAFDKGDYRWAAELLNHAVFAEPGHIGAKKLLASTYDQMAYTSESALWRNSYLTGAAELRNGPPKKGITKADLLDVLAQTPTQRFLEAMAAGLDGPAAEGKDLKVNLVLTDAKESFVLWIENAVLHFKSGPADPNANATLTLTKGIFIKMIAGTAGVKDTLLSDDLKVGGSKIDLVRFFSLIDKAMGVFPIVTPK